MPDIGTQPAGDEWGESDPVGTLAWKAARDGARAAGGDLSELTDMHPADRASRISHLAGSDIAEERARGSAEMAALLGPEAAAVFDADTGLQSDLWAALAGAPWPDTAGSAVPTLLPLPDTDWAAGQGRLGKLVLQRRLGGRVLVVRESTTRPGNYYPAVDGQHLSARASPQTYRCALDAMTAAMAAVAGASNHNPPGATP